MAKNLYYFGPSTLARTLRKLPRSYRLISLNRNETPDWQLPAILVVEGSEGDLRRIERSAPRDDSWRLIYLLDGHAPRRLGDRVFALLPSKAPPPVIAKTVESAFDNLRADAERQRTRRQLHLVANELETLNKIGVALSTERNTDTLLELIREAGREGDGSDSKARSSRPGISSE